MQRKRRYFKVYISMIAMMPEIWYSRFDYNKNAETEAAKGTVAVALKLIDDMLYAEESVRRGVAPEKIRKYGFAFHGKTVLIS